MKKIISIITILAFSLNSLFVMAENETAESSSQQEAQQEAQQSSDQDNTSRDEIEPNITLIDDLKAVNLTAGIDFAISGDTEAIKKELETAFSQIEEIELNTVILSSTYEGKAYFSLEGESDPLFLANKMAREKGFSTFISLDIDFLINDAIKSDNIQDNYILSINKFASKYIADGIILTNYYTKNDTDAFNYYKKDGSGIGFKNWLYENNEYFVKTASEIIRTTNNAIAIGLNISHPWANKTTRENGSETSSEFQALTNGYSDTKKYIESKYADFIILNASGGTASDTLPFEKYTSWWNGICSDSNIPLYITHANENMKNNWSADQILKQLTIAKKLSAYKGSAFSSLKTLVDNPKSSTDNIKKFYENQINESDLFSDLSVYYPKKTSFTTYEDKITFMGTFDSNFDVYIDNEKIELEKTGDFYITKNLEIGNNTFKITHKDKSVTYKIKRAVKVLKSMNPSSAASVEGGTKMTVSATAYKGSTVKATFNGQTITLKESATDDIDINSLYIKYTGTFNIPNGVIGKTQSLGRVNITASYMDFTESLKGGNITVNALPEPPPPPAEPEVVVPPQDAVEGEVIMKIEPYIPKGYESTAKFIKTTSDSTVSYDGKTIDAYAFPNYVMLPKGTLDYYQKSVNATKDNGTVLNFNSAYSNRKYLTDESTVITAAPITQNQAFVKAIGTKNGKSYIKISLDHKIAFNIQPVGLTYLEHVEGNYRVNTYNPSKYEITFDNVTEVTKLPSFNNHQIFKSGEWQVVTVDGVQKFKLVLELRQQGIYGGISSYYDSNGDLILESTNFSNSLSGKTIVIDPGHGYTGKNRFDSGAVIDGIGIKEVDVNYAVAEALEKKLKALGANVVKFDVMNNTKYYPTEDRKIIAEQYSPDLYISIHCNSAGSYKAANGIEAYYFYASGQPLAYEVTKELNKVYQKYLYKDSKNHIRDSKESAYYRFNVTTSSAFPSILTEIGFVSNPTEAKLLSNAENQEHIAEGLKNGIVNYFSRSKLSNYSNGESTAEKPSSQNDDTNAVTQQTQSENSTQSTAQSNIQTD